MRIALPWPNYKKLSPNSRGHWGGKAGATKKARSDAAYAAYEAMQHGVREVRQKYAGAHPIPVKFIITPPDKRHRDDDNMIGAAKAFRDGIADALGVDDRRFRAEYVFNEPASPGGIEVIL